MVQAAGVVRVEVGQHNDADVGRRDAEPRELRPYLLVRSDVLAHGEPKEGRPPREVARLPHSGGRTRGDDGHPLGVLDRECVDRQRLSPLLVKER